MKESYSSDPAVLGKTFICSWPENEGMFNSLTTVGFPDGNFAMHLQHNGAFVMGNYSGATPLSLVPSTATNRPSQKLGTHQQPFFTSLSRRGLPLLLILPRFPQLLLFEAGYSPPGSSSPVPDSPRRHLD